MPKFTNCQVTFAEVPDEISLCIEISNCPIHCPECHSKELWGNIGQELTKTGIEDLLTSNRGVTCVCFMGGDAEPIEVNKLSQWVHSHYGNTIKTAWYSGAESYPTFTPDFDYIKIGPYKSECGPLNNPNTNQKFYKVKDGIAVDITYKFWKNDTNS